MPKFRYTGTAPDGHVSPVNWSSRKISVDAVLNGGVFLCLRPGYYQFTAALSPGGGGRTIDIWIVRNNVDQVKDT